MPLDSYKKFRKSYYLVLFRVMCCISLIVGLGSFIILAFVIADFLFLGHKWGYPIWSFLVIGANLFGAVVMWKISHWFLKNIDH